MRKIENLDPKIDSSGLTPYACEKWIMEMRPYHAKNTTPRLYVYFPLPLAAAIGLEPGESVQWELLDRGELHLLRVEPPPTKTKKRASKKGHP